MFPALVAAEEQIAGAAFSPSSNSPAAPEPVTSGSIDGDSDDGIDPVAAPAPVSLDLAPASLAESQQVGVLWQQPALQGHASGLERPPRLGFGGRA